MPNIKKFYNDQSCVVCGRGVKPWGRSKCDNCGGIVCARHRPYFAAHWQCSNCAARQQSFVGDQTLASVSDIDTMMRQAEKLIEEGNEEAADKLAGDFLSYLYKDV